MLPSIDRDVHVHHPWKNTGKHNSIGVGKLHTHARTYKLDELSIVLHLNAPSHGTLFVDGERRVPPVNFTKSQIHSSPE